MTWQKTQNVPTPMTFPKPQSEKALLQDVEEYWSHELSLKCQTTVLSKAFYFLFSGLRCLVNKLITKE